MPFEITAGQVIDPGTYKAQLTRVEENQGQYGMYRKWHFLVDVNGTGEELSVITSGNTGPQSKSFAWLTALLGRVPQAGERIEDPTGKTVLVSVVTNKKGFSTIDSLMPIVEPVQQEAGIPR